MKIAGFIFGVILTVIGFYLGGYDFNHRGDTAIVAYVGSLIFGALSAILFSTFD